MHIVHHKSCVEAFIWKSNPKIRTSNCSFSAIRKQAIELPLEDVNTPQESCASRCVPCAIHEDPQYRNMLDMHNHWFIRCKANLQKMLSPE